MVRCACVCGASCCIVLHARIFVQHKRNARMNHVLPLPVNVPHSTQLRQVSASPKSSCLHIEISFAMGRAQPKRSSSRAIKVLRKGGSVLKKPAAS